MNYADWSQWYDLFYSTESGEEVDFYVGEAIAANGPVLEIGVGTGRIAIPVAKRGIEVFGVDMSPEMLAAAESKASAASPLTGSLTLAEADMRTLRLAKTDFAQVTIPARTLLLATAPEDQADTLCSAARHLRPGGKLVLNVFNPTPDLIFDGSEESVLIGEVADPATGKTFRLSAINRFNQESQINNATQIVEDVHTDGSTSVVAELPVTLRYLFPHEIFAMIEDTNLQVEAVYGWFDKSPFDEECEEIIFVASRLEESKTLRTPDISKE
jgi:ubiquinone/menaquinone biosynthesis C-methylase UbiE